VIVLLPPSEGKHSPARGRPLDLDALLAPSELTATRTAVLDALATVSAGADAAYRLGVPPTLDREIARNTRLLSAPTAPAGQVYTGVLYAALDLASLDTAARRRAARRLVVVSALFGALRIGDRVPAYRLAMGVDLPGIGPLAAAWREPLGAVLPGLAGRGVVVDCRSAPYAAAWTPRAGLAERWVQIRVPGASHGAKHTRGLAARELCRSAVDPRRPEDLAAALGERFAVRLHEPARSGRPWILDCQVD